MLLQFSVENFLSFKEKNVFSMLPTADKAHGENIITSGDAKAINTAVVYGANASGKSNLFSAMGISIMLLRSSNLRQINEIMPVTPFKFSEDSYKQPSFFEYIFIAKDNKKYVYGFSVTQEKVIDEYLYKYNSRRPSVIFERKNTVEYEFPVTQKKQLEPLTQWNSENKFFISTATMWNAESTKSAFEWLSSCFDTLSEIQVVQNIALSIFKNDISEKKYIDFTKELLKNTDINISDISINMKTINNNDLGFGFLPRLMINNPYANTVEKYEFEIVTDHIVKEGNKQKHYKLNLMEESLGTQQLFYFAPLLKTTFEKGSVLLIDELDRSLHPHVVKYLVNMFRDEKINKNGAQLIATTHDTTLLDLDLLRRDQIFFVEKQADTGVSDVFPLADFSVRKSDNIEKAYLIGRYGAVPYIKGEDRV